MFDAKPIEEFSSLLESAANVGGGYRVAVIILLNWRRRWCRSPPIFSVNSSFSAVTLPLALLSRALAESGVHRKLPPTSGRLPRWLGNLKRYKLQLDSDGSVDLVDSQGTWP